MQKLAARGGEPVRKRPFPNNYLGVTLYDEKEMAQLADVINDKSPFRHYGIGTPRKVEKFEEAARDYFGTKFALAVANGTGALFCAAAALGIGPGDEVILPTFSWLSDYYAITNFGALPVFADIDETLSVDPADFERRITPRTKAVITVAFQGCPPKMDEICAIAKKRGVKVIEDIAQAFGGSYHNKKQGTFGDVAIASFQQNKTLCCGEGGLLLTDDEEYFVRAARYHDLGMMRPIFADQVNEKNLLDEALSFSGNQYRMNEFAGAVMLAQLEKLDGLLEKCRAYHGRIRENLRDETNFNIRWVEGDCGCAVFFIFKTRGEAAEFESCLSAEGIPLGPKSACKNLMTVNAIQGKRLPHEALPPFGKGCAGEFVDYAALNETMRTDEILSRVIAVSIGPMYSDEDINDVITAIKKVSENLYPK